MLFVQSLRYIVHSINDCETKNRFEMFKLKKKTKKKTTESLDLEKHMLNIHTMKY